MLDWHPRKDPPERVGVEILLAFECFGSENHPTQPKQFLRWEYEVIEVANFDSAHELEVGWPANEASCWAYIPNPKT